jgi:hypothetical protein
MTVNEAGRRAVTGADRAPVIIESGGTARLHLTLATTDYDHVRDLHSGAVRPDGIVLTAFNLPVEEVFFRFIKNREWDISEMSFGKFIGYASQAIRRSSVFRCFPHACSAIRLSMCAATAASPRRKTWRARASAFRNGRRPRASTRADS